MAQNLPPLRSHHSLKSYHTMGVDVKAEVLTEFQSVDELKALIKYCLAHDLELMILGGGSNVLFTDEVPFCVAVNSMKGISVVEETETTVLLNVAGGEDWHELVTFAVDQKWGGIENLALIPGTVGAAPIQNIGAYGVELSEVVTEVNVLLLDDLTSRSFKNRECGFGYRNSIFKQRLKNKVVVTDITIRLHKNHKPNHSYASLQSELHRRNITDPDIRDVYESVIAVRSSKLPDPAVIGNTGSFFKNPVIDVQEFDQLKRLFPDVPGYPVTERQVKVPAGWLIEQAGWKGYRAGDAGVHDKQALVLVNHGKASGADLLALAHRIRSSVRETFAIDLQPEVNIIEP